MDDRSRLRSVLAGYDPERLRAGKVLVAGLGAAGQNVVQNLALTGVGHLLLVDHVGFERSDEICSPLYPTAAETARIGLGKAAVVAHRAVASGTASGLQVRYSGSLIQELGDGALAWADLVVATVDSPGTRAWLAQRCRLLGTPMIDGELSGPHFGLAAYPGTSGSPCYLCWRPDQDSPAAIAADALAAEAAAIVPALQTSGAVLAGYIAELVAQLLHGRTALLGYRTDGNARRQTLRTRQLLTDPGCRGSHAPEAVLGTVIGAREDHTLAELMTAITRQAGHALITLAEPVVLDAWCGSCALHCIVQATESAWLAQPHCTGCGGPWQCAGPRQGAGLASQGRAGQPGGRVAMIDTRARPPAELAATQLRALGLRAGASLHVTLASGHRGLLRLPGDALTCTELAVPPPAPPLLKAGNGLARWILP